MKQKLLAVFLSLTLLLSSFTVGGLATPVEAVGNQVGDGWETVPDVCLLNVKNYWHDINELEVDPDTGRITFHNNGTLIGWKIPGGTYDAVSIVLSEIKGGISDDGTVTNFGGKICIAGKDLSGADLNDSTNQIRYLGNSDVETTYTFQFNEGYSVSDLQIQNWSETVEGSYIVVKEIRLHKRPAPVFTPDESGVIFKKSASFTKNDWGFYQRALIDFSDPDLNNFIYAIQQPNSKVKINFGVDQTDVDWIQLLWKRAYSPEITGPATWCGAVQEINGSALYASINNYTYVYEESKETLFTPTNSYLVMHPATHDNVTDMTVTIEVTADITDVPGPDPEPEVNPILDTYKVVSSCEPSMTNIPISNDTQIVEATAGLDNIMKNAIKEQNDNYYIKVVVANGMLSNLRFSNNWAYGVWGNDGVEITFTVFSPELKIGSIGEEVTTYYLAYSDIKDRLAAFNDGDRIYENFCSLYATGTGTVTYIGVVEPPETEEHVHQYDGYGYDLNNHWQVCTVCSEKSESSPHVGTPCSVCGGVKHIDGETDIALSSVSANENVVYDDDSKALTVKDNSVELLTFPLGQKVNADEKVSVHIIGEVITDLTDSTSASGNAARVWIGGNSDFSETEYVSGTGTFEINKEFTVKSNGDNSFTDTLAIKGAAYGKKLPGLKIYHVAVKLPEKEPVECLPDEIVLDINNDLEIIGNDHTVSNGTIKVNNQQQIAVRLPKNVPQNAEIKVHIRGNVNGGVRFRLNDSTNLDNGKSSEWNMEYNSYTGEFDDIIDLKGTDVASRYLHIKGPQYINTITDLTITHIGIVYPKHEHTYADGEYKSDETGHWQVCTKCEEESEHTPHTEKVVSDEVAGHHSVCETCGYKMSETVEHIFGAWSKLDETHHTRSCEKCDYSEAAEHKMGNWTNLNDTQHTRNCSDCEHSEAAEHKFSAWTKLDENQHTHACNDCEFSQNENHNWDDGVVTKEPSEEEEGIKTYTCNDCKATKEETIPKTGHNHSFDDDWKSDETGHWHECIAGDGAKSDFAEHTYKDGVCTVCSYVHTAHTRGNNPVYTPAENEHTFKCDICGATVSEDHSVDTTVFGHDGENHWNTCSLCNANVNTVKHDKLHYVVDGANGKHYLYCDTCKYEGAHEDHKGGTATCTDQATCEVCGAKYGDLAKHTEVSIPGKPATCTESGLTDGTKCSVCGKILKAQETIPAKGHTKEVVKGKPATCTETGLTDGEKCSVCGEILKKQEELPALGHKYGEPAWTWSGDSKNATATFTCANDNTHVQVVNATVTSTTVLPTLTTPGATTYTAAAVFEGRTYTAQNVVVIPIPGPTGYSHLHTWAWDFDAVSHRQLCSGCGMYLNYGPHNFVNGICIDCGYVADVIDVNTPIEDTDQNSEEETSGDDLTVDDTQTPVESNPKTGLAVSALTLALAAVATVFSKRR